MQKFKSLSKLKKKNYYLEKIKFFLINNKRFAGEKNPFGKKNFK